MWAGEVDESDNKANDNTSRPCAAFLGGSDGKQSACNIGDPGLIPGSGRSLGQEDPLEKGMVTHSSILAWRIPWTEEPGRIQSMGSQRVGHN